eukprot:scaffold5638_cov63-Phaeocystis_antarctica.AAC.2
MPAQHHLDGALRVACVEGHCEARAQHQQGWLVGTRKKAARAVASSSATMKRSTSALPSRASLLASVVLSPSISTCMMAPPATTMLVRSSPAKSGPANASSRSRKLASLLHWMYLFVRCASAEKSSAAPCSSGTSGSSGLKIKHGDERRVRLSSRSLAPFSERQAKGGGLIADLLVSETQQGRVVPTDLQLRDEAR